MMCCKLELSMRRKGRIWRRRMLISAGAVLSTLVVAALFNPLRLRVQSWMDRRFNRSRYDAQRVVDDFSSHLSDDVDLEHMQSSLLETAQQTVQPAHLSLWVREKKKESL